MLETKRCSIFDARLYSKFIALTSVVIVLFSACHADQIESKFVVKIEQKESIQVDDLWRSSFFEEFTFDQVRMQVWTYHHFLYPDEINSAPVALVLIGKNDIISEPYAIRIVSEKGISLKRIITPSSAGEILFKLRFQISDCYGEYCPSEEVYIALKDKTLYANDQVLGRLEPEDK